MIKCHACLKELDIRPPIGRQEVCIFCGSDLHCCLNCGFYKIGAYNDCREPQAERVIEKSQNNFCDYFKLGDAEHRGFKAKQDDARNKLKSLFDD